MKENGTGSSRTDAPGTIRAYLVAILDSSSTAADTENLLDELSSLVDTMGLDVLGREIVKLKEKTPAFLTGSGKAKEIIRRAEDAARTPSCSMKSSPPHSRGTGSASPL